MTALYLAVVSHAAKLIIMLNISVSILDVLISQVNGYAPDRRQAVLNSTFERIKSELALSVQFASLLGLFAKRIYPLLALGSVALLLVLLTVQLLLLWLVARQAYGSTPARSIIVLVTGCVFITFMNALPLLPTTV